MLFEQLKISGGFHTFLSSGVAYPGPNTTIEHPSTLPRLPVSTMRREEGIEEYGQYD